MNFGAYWFSDKVVLSMYRAKEVTRETAPKLYMLVEELTRDANLPMPKVYVIEDATPNAFATGRDPENAAIAATTGILRILDANELRGVLSHELSHVKNRDILIGTIAATLVGTITYVAQITGWALMFGGRGSDDDNGISSLFLIILAPIVAVLLQLAISRSREYMADERGAEISKQPLSLASALQKWRFISMNASALQKLSKANEMKAVNNATPATAHMFIVNPLTRNGLMKLFSTHPPIEERIKRLQEIAEERK